MAEWKIGSCSWKYNSWEGIIYSKNKHINYLSEYSNVYSLVELDQWFWSLFGEEKVVLPKAEVVEEYVRSVPPDFLFTIKIPNSITLTHFYNKGKNTPLVANPHFLSNNLFMEFLERLAPMKKHVGLLMFQFEYLNKIKMPSKMVFLELFEAFIQKLPRDYCYGVEIRNPNYLDDSYFGFLKRNKLTHVFVQGYHMPKIVEIYNKYGSYIENTSAIRLIGTDRSGIEKKSGNRWDRILEVRDNELIPIVEMVKELVKKGVDVFINVNNHFEGSAPLTIKKMIEMLK